MTDEAYFVADEAYFVVVQTGCEGIEHVLWVGADAPDAVRKVQEYRGLSAVPRRRKDRLRWPLCDVGPDPDRICVLAPTMDRGYTCCCGELGVAPSRQMWR